MGLLVEIEKPPRELFYSLRGFIGSSFGNPTFSFYASEG
jgi:hypothetical protein